MSLWELRFKYNLTWNRLPGCNKHQILTGHLIAVEVSIPSLFKSLSGTGWLPPHSFSLVSNITHSFLVMWKPLPSPVTIFLSAESHSVGQTQSYVGAKIPAALPGVEWCPPRLSRTSAQPRGTSGILLCKPLVPGYPVWTRAADPQARFLGRLARYLHLCSLTEDLCISILSSFSVNCILLTFELLPKSCWILLFPPNLLSWISLLLFYLIISLLLLEPKFSVEILARSQGSPSWVSSLWNICGKINNHIFSDPSLKPGFPLSLNHMHYTQIQITNGKTDSEVPWHRLSLLLFHPIWKQETLWLSIIIVWVSSIL